MNAKAIASGIAAGAAGTAVLNATTYADMAIRARPQSKIPKAVVKEFARWSGVRRLPRARAQGLSMLLGYADGFGAGVLFGVMRPRMRGVPWFVAGLGLAALTLVLSEGTATAMGKTDPRQWGVSGWMTDFIPRAVYGCVTCLVYDALTES
ncbi:MAG TPA: hypothetical protein VJP85_03280 [Candidatus Baltobacteraceae bacterium]|nr:hypothetical protein [Candidatus Baltobacteraceae bacterium]